MRRGDEQANSIIINPLHYEEGFSVCGYLKNELEYINEPVFQIEGYLHYQESKLVSRFDANTYLCLPRVMDTHDLSLDRGSLQQAFCNSKNWEKGESICQQQSAHPSKG